VSIAIETERGVSALTLVSEVESQRFAHFRFKGKPPRFFDARGLGSFCYLAAERQGPRDTSVLQSVPKENLEMDFQGRSTANILHGRERDPIRVELEHRTAPKQRLLKQVEAWLSEFVPEVEIRTEFASGLDVVAVRFKRGDLEADWERPSNTGFGVSYSLPIVVAGLVAKPSSVLIVDSPEAHLHPSAQSAMGAFLGYVAASKVQVIVETHSDHILNGIRLAAIDPKHPLKRTNVVINHLRQVERQLSKQEIKIDARGSLSSRPAEFFDQAEIDLAKIVKQRFHRD
jgi:predicted ATPase